MHWGAKCASGESKAAGAGINDARGIIDPADNGGRDETEGAGKPHRHVPMRLYWVWAFWGGDQCGLGLLGGFTSPRNLLPRLRYVPKR